MPARVSRILLAVATLLAPAGTALAVPGVVVGGVNLRAGPGLGYPAVALLAPGTGAEILGCLPAFDWCDVAVATPNGVLRGWAAAPRLQLFYGGQPVLVPQYGPTLGLPLLGFDVDDYWSRYYRDRPWFGEAGRWRGDDRGFGPGPGPGYGGFRGGRIPGGEPGPFNDRSNGFDPGNRSGAPGGGFHPGVPGPGPSGSHPGGPPGPGGGPRGGPGGNPGRGPGGHPGDDHPR